MSILFLFQGISIDMDFCGPIKDISKVITHYQDHKIYGDSFLEYVVEDYIYNNTEKEEHHNDSDEQGIPAHSHQQCCQSLLLYVTNNNILSINQFIIEERKQINPHKEIFSSRYLESPFHPPQV
ncbi:hypothetical protein [Winogradskyella marincola]|uniref:Uncharacterized protein n=1 Tax=Winogradskyella marincola TaxID=3037795 RepID=A0ABT6FXT3_9FLAO|nr:hypothetical protein [Winogradskyella sp. YYF002]MDG4714596.1 hypothetical protein [Winogradskyella sp. YYF002]